MQVANSLVIEERLEHRSAPDESAKCVLWRNLSSLSESLRVTHAERSV